MDIKRREKIQNIFDKYCFTIYENTRIRNENLSLPVGSEFWQELYKVDTSVFKDLRGLKITTPLQTIIFPKQNFVLHNIIVIDNE